MLERIDKIIGNQTGISRKEIHKMIKNKKVKVNDKVVVSPKEKYDSSKDSFYIDNELLVISKYVYLVLNKPKGYVSATLDHYDKTVLDLVPEVYQNRHLFPAGRLDKDTTGFLLLTDDGGFAHNILSPKKHIKKKYYVLIDSIITNDMIEGFSKGVILDGEMCKSAILEKLDNNSCYVTLTEGKYHQIKRMFQSFGATVLELKRVSMGSLELPSDLALGECRELTKDEVYLITH